MCQSHPDDTRLRWRQNSVLSDPGPVSLFIPSSYFSQSCFLFRGKMSELDYDIYIRRIILHVHIDIIYTNTYEKAKCLLTH